MLSDWARAQGRAFLRLDYSGCGASGGDFLAGSIGRWTDDALALINPPADPVRTSAGEAIATEAWVFGRLPLAFSARCFTARHHRVAKDDCGFRCIADPDGLLLSSSEGQPFLVLNGTQTQSATVQNLLGDGAALRAAGVSRLRLSPCAQGFTQVLADFDAVMNDGAAPGERAAAWAGSAVRTRSVRWSAATGSPASAAALVDKIFVTARNRCRLVSTALPLGGSAVFYFCAPVSRPVPR